MIPEFGHYALVLALCLACMQATIPLIGAARDNQAFMRLAQYTSIGQFFFIGLSFFILAYCFLSNDFSVAYVAENSNTHLPFMYRFCAVWGAHEGSLLLWVFILSLWTALVSVLSRSLPLDILARVLAVLGMISVGFLLFSLTTSDPFARLLPNIPVNGHNLNPILQDPGLAIHPPMLYMGYVGFSVAFAFAIAALMSGKLDAAWARWSRPWTVVAWCFLTFGIVLGSWWAYRELGWGGWWFWDPVENASFLPWLVGTALLHSLAVTGKRDVFKAWTVLLAVTAFSLSLLGTFLVRSGILISVHAFAVDPQRGLFMLRFLVVVVGASLTLYACRAHRIVNTGRFALCSRESFLLANNIILFVGMVTVLLGTLYPLIIGALGLGKLSVGAPYFNEVFIPLMLPLLFLMGIGPLVHWQQMNFKSLWKRLLSVLIFSVVIASLLPVLLNVHATVYVLIGLSLAFWIITQSLSLFIHSSNDKKIQFRLLNKSQTAMLCAHVGVAVTVIGLSLTTAYSVQRNLSMRVGDRVGLGPYTFIFEGVRSLQGPDYSGVKATVLITEGQQQVALLHPELRNFPVQQTTIGKTAIDAHLFRDLYVALGSPLPSNAWELRIYYKPFVRWIWAGGLLMVIGGIIALFDRRYKRSN